MIATRRHLPKNRLLAIAIASLLACLALSASARAAEKDDAEMQARTHFAAGRYSQALEIYARLYAETFHPTYLHNVARCHQNLRDPDQAIASFREYLRKAKDLTPEQRAAVEGHIAEMEQLQKTRAASGTAAAPPPEPPAPPPVAPLPATPPSPPSTAPSPTAAPLVGPPTVTTSRADEQDGPAIYTRWWFWTTVGGVAVGGIVAALLLSGDDQPHGNLGLLDVSDKWP